MPFGHMLEREGLPIWKRKRERREPRAPLLEGPLALTLSLLGGGLSPSAHGQALYGLHLYYAHMHAFLHAINGLSIQWGEISYVPMGHGPMHTYFMLKGSFICHIPLLSVPAMHACLDAINFLIFDWLRMPGAHVVMSFMLAIVSTHILLHKSLVLCILKFKPKNHPIYLLSQAKLKEGII